MCIFSSRTEGSISGSNSSLELYSVSRQPDVRRQKVVPTQKTCVISPPRNTENKLSISPRQHLVMSPWRLTETDQQEASKSESQDEVVCLDDDDEDSDVICIPDDHEKAYSPASRSCPHNQSNHQRYTFPNHFMCITSFYLLVKIWFQNM